MRWYIPSLFGDIELNADGGHTWVAYEKVSPLEKEALDRLAGYASAKGWNGDPIIFGASGQFLLQAPLDEVRTQLVAYLKPESPVASFVRFADGKITEFGADDVAVPQIAGKPKKEKPTKGTTVDRPTIGCPAPDFDRADIRATRVLKEFLTAQQLVEWNESNAFVCLGADSGHAYLVISRNRPEVLRRYGGRSVFDLDEQRPYCVHNWAVPAAEEVLGLALHLQTPGNESYVREIPDA